MVLDEPHPFRFVGGERILLDNPTAVERHGGEWVGGFLLLWWRCPGAVDVERGYMCQASLVAVWLTLLVSRSCRVPAESSAYIKGKLPRWRIEIRYCRTQSYQRQREDLG
jgi:hypothetical protein